MIATILALLSGAAMPSGQEPTLPPLEHVTAATDAAGSSISQDCGAYCLAIAGSIATSAPMTFERAKGLVDPDGDGRCSLADLDQGFDALGVAADAYESRSSRIPPGLNVLFVKSASEDGEADHFIVSQELSDGRYRFYAPPIGTRVSDGEFLAKLWPGKFLHLGAETTWTPPFWSLVLAGALVTLALARRRSVRLAEVRS